MSSRITRVDVAAAPLARFHPLLSNAGWDELTASMRGLADRMRGHVVWNINSTARGGGVAELLGSLIPYSRDAGVDERWLVIEGSRPFFEVTKKVHNLLHGIPVAEDGHISEADSRIYEETLAENAAALIEIVSPGDTVIAHDPQVAGLVGALAGLGAGVIWRAHIGVDEANDVAREAWRFLLPYLEAAEAFVFSRRQYVWEGMDEARVHIIPPSIDPFAVKNQDLDGEEVLGILGASGIVGRTAGLSAPSMRHQATMCGGPLPPDARVVVQVSRWDRLKDPLGVIDGFAEFVAPRSESWLVLAGPETASVPDDPEQPEILQKVIARRASLPTQVRDRVLIAQLPMQDLIENAAIVNALQRRADIVVQKSLAEGFGLTVAEAMWKAKPIVASRVGGIEDQIEHERSGLLVDDPSDLGSFGSAVMRLLDDPALANRLGEEARRRSIQQFIAPRHLVQQARLLTAVSQ